MIEILEYIRLHPKFSAIVFFIFISCVGDLIKALRKDES